MKKTVCLVLSMAIILSLAACGSAQKAEISSANVRAAENEFRISMPDVANKTLPVAIQELENLGFTNITSNANDPNWNQERWLVVDQNYPAGELVPPSEGIVLTCKKLCQLYIDIKSESNLMLNRYDIELYIENEEIGTVANGNQFTKLLTLKEGKYDFIAYKTGDHSISTSKSIFVSGDMTFQCLIKHDKSSMEFRNINTVDNIDGSALVMIETINVVLADAMTRLSEIGFSNVREEPFDKIWDKDNWIVVGQNIEAGESIDKNTFIQLDCIKLDEYFNNTYAGKSAAEILSLAAESGFTIRFEDSAGTNQTERITNADDVERADWIALNARQYGFDRTVAVVVEYKGIVVENTPVPTPSPVLTAAPTLTPTQATTSSPSSTPTAKKYTDSEVKKFISDILSQTFMNSSEYNVTIKESVLTIEFYPEGITALVYRALALEDASAIKEWNSLVKAAKDWSKDLSKEVKSTLERDDLLVSLFYCDDTGASGNVFLCVTNGTVYYDGVNGINLLGLAG